MVKPSRRFLGFYFSHFKDVKKANYGCIVKIRNSNLFAKGGYTNESV